MEKEVMMQAVKEVLIIELNDGDFGMKLCELVWEKLFADVHLADSEDAAVYEIFNECYKELLKKIVTCLETQQ